MRGLQTWISAASRCVLSATRNGWYSYSKPSSTSQRAAANFPPTQSVVTVVPSTPVWCCQRVAAGRSILAVSYHCKALRASLSPAGLFRFLPDHLSHNVDLRMLQITLRDLVWVIVVVGVVACWLVDRQAATRQVQLLNQRQAQLNNDMQSLQ